MLEITAQQEALLRLPDPSQLLPKLAQEIRRDHGRAVADLSPQALRDEVARSHDHAAYALKITHLPTLVAWIKADVAWARGLRSNPTADLWIRRSTTPSLTAADLLAALGR
ncbi:hypothetical protein [Xanthomonas oryzae]|uniref:Uncharacterized protein n=1 Tax=Xanthomonas oryzae pv. leersiae TaxID=3112258 RepID=A0AAJ6GS04_9XANT|nr:hypothetical protein [Xanthomonas oryzae]ALS96405.1 hypothetical protein AXO1947_19995 [Xanthomonas oryzae pv. oryzae]AUI92200.1 hypothetical protein BVV16_22400 [Xanthomonas oryzae pv. oryzae]AUI95875.1 hypothetical protein BVV17_22435 [Xanthomonas oryzae pv. oryzae]AUI99550.1 hypothetical protein BVV18_22440 [Xanthomonas oryzae pv. oryzae]AUJ03224.1 hypothetical protein BVV10_22400 [Xanthomonas oryzae pv. oryzae]